MKFNIFKRGFSLTELLIVLVVVGVLFAAMLPLMTKRSQGGTTGSEKIWVFVKDDTQRDAFFDSSAVGWTSTAYVGVNPKDIPNDQKQPYAKMVVKTKPLQDSIQFRTGNDGDGNLTGLFYVDSKGNLLLTHRLTGSDSNNYKALIESAPAEGNGTNSNTAIGPGVFADIGWTAGSTAVGANSSMGKDNYTLNAVTSVGKNSNRFGKSNTSVLVGANVGNNEDGVIQETVAIGANSLGLPASKSDANVFLGRNVASVGFTQYNKGNVIVNSLFMGDEDGKARPDYSTIIGANTYNAGYNGIRYFTAIGNNACASFNKGETNLTSYHDDGFPITGGITTCIGTNTAGKWQTSYGLGWINDPYDHLFIGGSSYTGGGRGVLEIHNFKDGLGLGAGKDLKAAPTGIGPTVVLNSHLVVRGNLYIPDSNTGKVWAISGNPALGYAPVPHQNLGKEEKGKDRCGNNCGCWRWRRRYKCRDWRSKPECDWILFGLALFGLLLMIALACTGYGAIIAIGNVSTGVLLTDALIAGAAAFGSFGSIMGGIGTYVTWSNSKKAADGYYRGYRDPASLTGITYQTIDGASTYCNGSVSQPYFYQYMNSIDRAYCPTLGFTTSDARLKENITENTDAIEKLLMVQPYNYTFKADNDKVAQVGVMAQDLQQYFPLAVFSNPSGYLSIRWDEIFFATINSVKSLDGSANKLNNEIIIMEQDAVDIAKDQKAIQKRINDLNKRVTKLENN